MLRGTLTDLLYPFPATVGARIGAPPPTHSQSIGWVALTGENDFPCAAETVLKSWNINLILKRVEGARTTRGLLEYTDATFGGLLIYSLYRVALPLCYTITIHSED